VNWISGTLTVLWVLWGFAGATADAVATELPPGIFSVRGFGAQGDGKTDDTEAFQQAIDAAADVGGVAWVDPVEPGGGYVITRTVHVRRGATLMGAPAGMPFIAWEGTPRDMQRGPVILARPREEDYAAAKKAPLFELHGGNTVRGLYILYDEQPWPSDDEVDDPDSPYHYDSPEALTERFIADHARPYGPTFYLQSGVASITLEDITCGRYYDFYVQRHGGKIVINRCYLYGYKRAFAIAEARDVVRISSIHIVPNVEESISWQHAKLHGAITAQDDNVGFEFGSVDGYSLSDVCGFLLNTGFRLGTSEDRPFLDPVRDERVVHKWGEGPWGSVHNMKFDNCMVGAHCVLGTILTNQISNAMVFVSIRPTETFAAEGGDIGRQAAILVEPSFTGATLQITNLCLSSFNPSRVITTGAMVAQADGRAFLVDCPVSAAAEVESTHNRPTDTANIDIAGLVVSNIPESHLFGATAGTAPSVDVRGLVMDGRRRSDCRLGVTGPQPLSH